MINIKFNNKSVIIEKDNTLENLLYTHGFIERHFAVAINKEFVMRSRYLETYLKEGDFVETVEPMQGG